MSNNSQLLVKEYGGKFYVFSVMAESWGEWDDLEQKPKSDINHLELDRAKGVFDTRDEAHKFAHKLYDNDPLDCEYGVVDEVLYKDGAPVVINQPKKGKG